MKIAFRCLLGAGLCAAFTGGLAFAQAGGPTGSSGPIVIPKQPQQQPSAPVPAPTPTPAPPQYVFRQNVREVQIPVTVITKGGQFIRHLQAANFKLWENGKLQTIQRIEYTDKAPITAVMLVEDRAQWWQFIYQTMQASYYFTQEMQPQDWVALVTYDLNPRIAVDFTHDPRRIQYAINQLQIPGMSEGDLYDSLSSTLDRMSELKGRKILILISTGVNTFSHITWGTLEKRVKASRDISIFPISMGWQVREYLESSPQFQMMDAQFVQADAQMQYLARWTGGRFFQPRFEGEYPDIFREIADTMRNQYILYYSPTDTKLDGTFRKVKVEVVGRDGKPLRVVNQKGKKISYEVQARNGYYAPHEVE